MRKVFKISWRFVRFVLLVVLTVVLLSNIFIVLTGRFYLYKGIYNTYLQGKSGPGIYDLAVFPYSTINTSAPAPLQKATNDCKYQLSTTELADIKTYGTTALLVLKNDSIVFEKYFEKHNVQTFSNAFSAAKTVVSLLIGIALEEGKIKSLDEPVGNYLPSYATNGREKLTIRHLLYMASGLSWTESGKNPLSDNAESYYGNDLYGLVMRQDQTEKPGIRFNYQSGNSQLLGFILEKATGKSVSKYCEEKLWKPMGADLSAYWSLDKEQGDEKAFCCLYATTHDYAKLGLLILHKGFVNNKQIISEKYMTEMITPAPISTEEGLPNTRYGLHVWLTTVNGKKVIYCRGILGQYIVSIPQDNIVMVRLGHKRKKNYTYEDYKAKTIPADRIDHPKDVFEFIHIAEKCM